ncbi:MAG: hypothetical protein IMZ71_01575 [Chloroflexi bacterium]|nr:hypothetical protein [Chloroflexota bacterium]
MTSDVTDVVNISASVSTDGSTTNVNIAFKYRLSSASATNTWGAITDATSDGTTDIAAASAQDNCSILIDIDPAVVGKAVDGANSVRLDIVATNCPICLASTTAFLEHKYPGNTMSSTY